MLPQKIDACYINQLNFDMVFNGIFPKFSLTDLKIFSLLNKECFFMYQKKMEQLCYSKEIYKRKLLDGGLRITHHKKFQTDSSSTKLCTNQTALSSTEIYSYYTYTIEVSVPVIVIKQFNLISKSEKIMEFGPKIGNVIEKIVPFKDKVYAICSKVSHRKEIENKLIIIMDFNSMGFATFRNIAKSENPYLKKVKVGVESTILEVYEDKFYSNHGPDTIDVYASKTAELISQIKCEDANVNNKIVGIKIDCGCLYIRLFEGTIHIYNLESQKRIHTIVGPNCKKSIEHFEIRNKCLYTASDFSVTLWEMIDNQEKVKFSDKIELSTLDTQNVSSHEFDFQLDDTIIYIGLFKTIVEAHEIVKNAYGEMKFNYLTPVNGLVEMGSKWKIKECFVNEGVLFATLYRFSTSHRKEKYYSEIINLNPAIRSFKAITHSDIPKKSKFPRFETLKKSKSFSFLSYKK